MTTLELDTTIAFALWISRKRAGLTQKQLAKLSGIGDKSISTYEVMQVTHIDSLGLRCYRTPSFSKALRLFAACQGVEPAELLSRLTPAPTYTEGE